MNTRHKLLSLLIQGGFHSGEALGRHLGLSRAAVWRHIQGLGEVGLSIDRVPGRGYRLTNTLELLCPDRIRQSVSDDATLQALTINVHHELESTNQHLLRLAQQGAPSGHACLAEYQSHGRGRRGRQWISPFGCNLYLSLLWRFNEAPTRLGALPLAVAVAIVRALGQLDIDDIQIKWPNDLLWRGRKLGGILLEMGGDPTSACHIVSGIGLNIHMDQKQQAIDQPWVSLSQITRQPLSRNHIAGLVLLEITTILQQIEQHGLGQYLSEWRQFDAFADRPVKLLRGEQEITGISRGIDDDGNLLLEINGTIERFHSGEISLRPAP